jgi:hypothetical protein
MASPETEVSIGSAYVSNVRRRVSAIETARSEGPLYQVQRFPKCYIYYNGNTRECYIHGVPATPENLTENSGYPYPLASVGDNTQKAIQNFENWYTHATLPGLVTLAPGIWGYNDLTRSQAEQVRDYILNKTPEIVFKTEFDYIGGPIRPPQVQHWNMIGGRKKRTKCKKRITGKRRNKSYRKWT